MVQFLARVKAAGETKMSVDRKREIICLRRGALRCLTIFHCVRKSA